MLTMNWRQTMRHTAGNGLQQGKLRSIRPFAHLLVLLALAVTAKAQPVITAQPMSRTNNAGSVATFSVTANGISPLQYQWSKGAFLMTDGANIWGSTNSTLALSNLVIADSGSYSVVITDASGSVTSSPAVLTVNHPLADLFNPGANNSVGGIAVQRDGKILVGGNFTALGGQNRTNLVRLHSDGTIDTAFNPMVGVAPNNYSWVLPIALQGDGRILVGGWFGTLNGQDRFGLARLNSNGTLDAAFNPRANGFVNTIAVQPDGKIVVAGGFNMLGGQSRIYIGRLNSDGTVDANFNPGVVGDVSALVVQPDGKILVGGNFSTLAGQSRSCLGRLNTNGTLDTAFNPGATTRVEALALQPDGRILVGGSFTNLAGQNRNYLGRLNANGTLDASFNPGADGQVRAFALQADGKILLGGGFTTLGGERRARIGRLNPDGSVDATFNPGAGGGVSALMLQPDGRILVGGTFNSLGGMSRSFFGRLNNTDPATQSVLFDGATLTWLRGGTAPELSLVTMDVWQNGSWFQTGSLTRIAGGWQITGLSVSTSSTVRVQGVISGGQWDASSSIEEAFSGSIMITSQPANRTNFVGAMAAFSVAALGDSPKYQWFNGAVALTDGGGISGSTNSTLTLSNVLAGHAGNYSVVISNSFGVVTSSVAMLTVNSPLDAFNPGASGVVYSFAQQADGKIVVGGGFNSLGGQSRSRLGRLNADGQLDNTFNPGPNSLVYSLACCSDGKIVVGGDFFTLGGQSRSRLGRLNSDGSLDMAFNPGPNGAVYSLALQPDGKLLVAGNFTTLGGQTRNYLGRLNADGSLDSAFNPAPNGTVNTLALQPDGKIVVAGGFTYLGGLVRVFIGRLNANGTVDTNFNPAANSSVYSLSVQSNGKILVGGGFTSLNDQSRSRLGRLNADGTLDATFNPGAGGSVYSLALQADGRIFVGGLFTTLGGQSRTNLGRLNVDGTVDTSFNPGVNGQVNSMALQSDGKLLVGGGFSILGGQSRTFLGRLHNTDSAIQSLVFTGPSLTWLRAGGSPEFSCAMLDVWQNGAWTNLTNFSRVLGGWQLTGLVLSSNSTIRLQGNLPGGYYNGSSGMEEMIFGQPQIALQPLSQANFPGSNAVFFVSAIGGLPMHYQWFKDNSPLASGGNLAGCTNPTLMVSNLLGPDSGDYAVVVTNAFGSVTSSVAALSVLLPPEQFTGQILGDGLLLQFIGTPSYPYVLQSATNLEPPVIWQSIFTNSTDAAGGGSFAVTNFMETPNRFFKVFRQ